MGGRIAPSRDITEDVLAYVLRRLAWSLPTLFGVVVGVYFLSTLLPLPADAPASLGASSVGGAGEVRALPRFVNSAPDDVQGRVRRAVDEITSGSDEAAVRLADMGSAAWPTLMRRWPSLDAQTQERAASAALRAASSNAGDASDAAAPAPPQAVAATRGSESPARQFELLWGDRSMDFTETSRARALQRLLGHPSAEREADYIALGTYGLEPVFDMLQRTDRRDAWMGLTRVASRITQIDDAIHETDDASQTSACLVRWRKWWLLHESQYARRPAIVRPFAPLTETGFGKRLGGIYISLVTARSTGDHAHLAQLADSAALTLALVISAISVSYILAAAYAALSHARRGNGQVLPFPRRAGAVALTLLFALPAVVSARALNTLMPGGLGALIGPVLILIAGCLPSIARQEHAALSDAIRSDYLRTARAKGASERRVLVLHALRATVGPTLVWAGAEVPGLLGLSLVVEELWDIHGLGWQTLRAVEQRNETALMANALLLGAVAVLASVVADLVNALVDPRARTSVAERVAQ